jgi:hypothetical protein
VYFPRPRARLLAANCVLALSLVTSSALAQSPGEKEAARELLTRGQELREGGDLTGAIQALTQAHALVTTPITALELARTHAQAGHLVQARELALSVARIGTGAKESEQAGLARKEAADLAEQLRPRIATLHVAIQGVPAGREVAMAVDGAPIPSAAVGAPLRLDPGHHEVTARVGTGPQARVDVTVAEGESRSANIMVQVVDEPVTDPKLASAPATAPPPSAPPEERGTSPLVWVGFGVTAVGLAVGSVTGLLALSKAETVGCDGSRCTGAGIDDIESGRTLATVSTISFVVAVVGAGLGVYGLTLGAPKRTALRVLPGLGGGSLAGTF